MKKEKGSSSNKGLFELLFAIGAVILMGLITAAYLLGSFKIYGKSISIFSFVAMLFEAFDLEPDAIYPRIYTSVVGILYILFAIRCIRKTVTAILGLRPFLSGKSDINILRNACTKVYNSCSSVLMSIMTLIAVSRLLNVYEQDVGSLIILGSAVFIIVVLRCGRELVNGRYNWLDALYDLLGTLLMVISCILALINTMNISDGFARLFTDEALGNEGVIYIIVKVYELFADNFLAIVLAFCILGCLSKLLSPELTDDNDKSKKARSGAIIIIAAAIIVLRAVIYIYLGDNISLTSPVGEIIEYWYSIIKADILPVLLLGIGISCANIGIPSLSKKK